MTLFLEQTEDALYSQTNATVTPTVTNIQHFEPRYSTKGLEVAFQSGRFPERPARPERSHYVRALVDRGDAISPRAWASGNRESRIGA